MFGSRKHPPGFPPFQASPPLASIVIVTYFTRGRFIAKCLDALRRQTYPHFEVIIVDNGSTDETLDTLRRECRGEIVLPQGRNLGFAGGCNVGIRHARGEVIVLLNFDTEVEADWLDELIRPLRDDPRIAITGCKMRFPGTGRIQHAGGILHPNGMTQHVGYGEEDKGQYDQLADVDYVTGAGMGIRRSFLDRCGGGLDEAYFPAYCEEVDLCFRARRMRYRVVFTPKSVMTHHESPHLTVVSEAFQRMVYRNRVLFCLKNYTLREWARKFIPFEYWWLRSPWSKGFRKKQIRAYLEALLAWGGYRFKSQPAKNLEKGQINPN